jgi:hypothetical protein
MACIACDSRDSYLLLIRLTPEKGEVISQPEGFIDTAVFDGWLEKAFQPERSRQREEDSDHGRTILVFDNYSAYSSARFGTLCVHNRILA